MRYKDGECTRTPKYSLAKFVSPAVVHGGCRRSRLGGGGREVRFPDAIGKFLRWVARQRSPQGIPNKVGRDECIKKLPTFMDAEIKEHESAGRQPPSEQTHGSHRSGCD